MSIEKQIESIILKILKKKGVNKKGVCSDESLFEDGAGLDSLDLAELSVVLEHELKSDPFSQGIFPRTVGDLLSFYREKGDAH